MMKPINILSFSKLTQQSTIDAYKTHMGINVKPHEFESLKILCDTLTAIETSVLMFDNFYISYSIPQIPKEFDLLRIDEKNVVNIELKKESTIEKIQQQLIKNKYYLSSLGKNLFLFAFDAASQKLYMLFPENDKLEGVGIDVLVSVLKTQNKLYTDNLNKLFNPSNYLVSPFNSTDKFLRDCYFLTDHQNEIKKDIIDSFMTSQNNVITIEGKAGTGKTLLLYDISKQLRTLGKKVLIIHVGNLNKGQYKLNSVGWNIYPVKRYYETLNNALDSVGNCKYDIIILDETQRINIFQLNQILDFIAKNNINCIVGFDSSQTLCDAETYSVAIKTIKAKETNDFKLTTKIRTNKNIADFISAMFDLNKKQTNYSSDNISLIHFDNKIDAKEYINNKKDYSFINYTPSTRTNSVIDNFEYVGAFQGSSHAVIGQEFDNVIVWLDDIFYYDSNKELQAHNRSGNIYDQRRMLFQAVTRVKFKLEIVVVNNQKIFEELLKIFS